MKEKILTEYQFQLLDKIKDGDYLYGNHKRLEGLTTVLVELLSKDTELLYSIIDGYFGDERVINAITDYLNSQDQEGDILKDTKLFSSWVHNGKKWKEYIPEEWREDWEVDTRIIPPSFYKELKKHKYNMKKYIKSKLIKLTTK